MDKKKKTKREDALSLEFVASRSKERAIARLKKYTKEYKSAMYNICKDFFDNSKEGTCVFRTEWSSATSGPGGDAVDDFMSIVREAGWTAKRTHIPIPDDCIDLAEMKFRKK